MKQLAPFALFLFSFQTLLPMDDLDKKLDQELAGQQQDNSSAAQAVSQQQAQQPKAPTASTVQPTVPQLAQVVQQEQIQQKPANQPANYQSLGSLVTAPLTAVYRNLQYQLGANDIEWRILHGEQAEGATIVATYWANMNKGIKDPIIIAKYAKRKRIASDIAENLTLKLATFCTNYHQADKKVSFLTTHNDEWQQITETDIARGRFLVDEYPHTLLLPEIVEVLKDRLTKIQAIVDSIENSDKK